MWHNHNIIQPLVKSVISIRNWFRYFVLSRCLHNYEVILPTLDSTLTLMLLGTSKSPSNNPKLWPTFDSLFRPRQTCSQVTNLVLDTLWSPLDGWPSKLPTTLLSGWWLILGLQLCSTPMSLHHEFPWGLWTCWFWWRLANIIATGSLISRDLQNFRLEGCARIICGERYRCWL